MQPDFLFRDLSEWKMMAFRALFAGFLQLFCVVLVSVFAALSRNFTHLGGPGLG